MDPFPTPAEIDEDIAVAAVGATSAANLRSLLRRRSRRGDPERQKLILAMVATLEGYGSILRSHLKRSDYHSPPFSPYSALARRRIKRTLRQLRYERRQIKKMLP